MLLGLLALTALVTALTVIFPWEELEGSDTPPGYLRFVAHGAELQLGRWLIAVGGAGVVWALVYMRSRNVYVALAGVALASGGVGISVTAINDALGSIPSSR